MKQALRVSGQERGNTLAEHGAMALRALCEAAGLDQESAVVSNLWRVAAESWGERPISSRPDWRSDVGIDHTPFEYSIALGGGAPQVRFLVEAQGETPTVEAYRSAALALSERLSRTFGARLERLRAVEDLFFPKNAGGGFGAWHGFGVSPGGTPEFKIYLDPQARGREQAAATIEEALCRLGLRRAWPTLAGFALRRGPVLDELKYFSLDLSADDQARVKVYTLHHDATAEQLEEIASASPHHVAGDLQRFCTAMSGHEGPYRGKPAQSCQAFTLDSGERPVETVLHFPISHHAPEDRMARARIIAYLASQGLSSTLYERCLEAVARRPLEEGVGLQSYASFKRAKAGPRLNVYLSPEVYQVLTARNVPAYPPRSDAQRPAVEILDELERHTLLRHPFFERLAREPADLTRLWLLMANGMHGIVENFTRWLASVTGRTEDGRIRCFLARLLNDEMGDGDYAHAHHHLFAKIVEGLETWKLSEAPEALFAPGRQMRAWLEEAYGDPDPYVGVGVTIAMEVFGDQANLGLMRELRRGETLTTSPLKWLAVHQGQEAEHAEGTLALARLIPAEGPALEAVWRGARRTQTLFDHFFNAMYRVCYVDFPERSGGSSE